MPLYDNISFMYLTLRDMYAKHKLPNKVFQLFYKHTNKKKKQQQQ